MISRRNRRAKLEKVSCSLISKSHPGFTEGQLSLATGRSFCSKSVGVPRRCLIGLSGAV